MCTISVPFRPIWFGHALSSNMKQKKLAFSALPNPMVYHVFLVEITKFGSQSTICRQEDLHPSPQGTMIHSSVLGTSVGSVAISQ